MAIAGCLVAAAGAGAQGFGSGASPISASSAVCAGERIDTITYTAVRRNVGGGRSGTDRSDGRSTGGGERGAWINGALAALQPQTDPEVIRQYLLLAPGGVCEEQRRIESERILRAQPFIADAVIHVHAVRAGAVSLEVVTSDEYSLFARGWGLSGMPIGVEAGSRNIGGSGRAVFGLAEIGRGNEPGFAARFTDYHAFGLPIRFEGRWASRQLDHSWGAGLSRPFLTNFQNTSWEGNVSYDRRYYTYREPSIRDVSLEYERRRWLLGGVRRIGGEGAHASAGIIAAGEVANPVRSVLIRERGPEPTVAPALTGEFARFDATRFGVAAGARSVRFLPVRGLSALSGPEDVPLGWELFGLALRGVDGWQDSPADWVSVVYASAAVGGPRSLLRFEWEGERRHAIGGPDPDQYAGSGRLAWFAAPTSDSRTTVSLEAAIAHRTRIPVQLTFRDDVSGLVGYHASEVGGSSRIVGRTEHRFAMPVPTDRAEFALAGLAEVGRIWAGDAPYGTNTSWKAGVGVALLAAVPKGSRHTLRIELGLPVGDRDRATPEIRLFIYDFTRRFWNAPRALWLAREAATAARAVGAP